MIGIELVQDRASAQPFPRSDRVTERVVAAAREGGLLLYSSTGCANGTNGDLVMLGPPFSITDEDRGAIVERTRAAIVAALPA
jgi:adenosylmethionine-8-amino-7-oxononanoate aminotransferase